jgi:hypothetical protein
VKCKRHVTNHPHYPAIDRLSFATVGGGGEWRLVQLLVPDGDLPALAALILEEAEDGCGDDAQHEEVACSLLVDGLWAIHAGTYQKQSRRHPGRS